MTVTKPKKKRRVLIHRDTIAAFYKAVRASVFVGEDAAMWRIQERYFKASAERRIK